MKIENFTGWVNIVNFPPNRWEYRQKTSYHLYLIHSDSEKWKTSYINKIEFGQNILLSTNDFKETFSKSSLALVYPSQKKLDPELSALPKITTWHTELPAWRASSGFKNIHAQVSYQSDLYPLPPGGTMLTFHPFIQFGELSNYLVVLNAQKDPRIIRHKLYIFNSKNKQMIDHAEIETNSVSVIGLDKYEFKQSDLPVFISTKMAAIPFGLGVSADSKNLSLEHTHPPASFVVRGDRIKIQKQIKSDWFKLLEVENL